MCKFPELSLIVQYGNSSEILLASAQVYASRACLAVISQGK